MRCETSLVGEAISVEYNIVATAVPPQVASIASGGWVQSAFVDPSDPTYIYTSQPYQPTDVMDCISERRRRFRSIILHLPM